MHVDGQAQGLKAPAVRMLKVSDFDNVVLAAADLTYAYNTRYAGAWSNDKPPTRMEMDFINGEPSYKKIEYAERETGNPKDFGWPQGDNTTDIGILEDTKMFGEPDIGFSGIYTWKRKYRQVSLLHAVRSTVLVRSNPGTSYVIVGDDFAMSGSAKHSFEMYLIMAPGVAISKLANCEIQPCICKQNPCMIQFEGGSNRFLTVHASTLGDQVSYITEPIEDSRSTRLIITSTGRNFEKFCTVLHPHEDSEASSRLTTRRTESNVSLPSQSSSPTPDPWEFGWDNEDIWDENSDYNDDWIEDEGDEWDDEDWDEGEWDDDDYTR